SGLTARVRLDRIRLRGLLGQGKVRLRALSVALTWALFVDLAALLASGGMLYFGLLAGYGVAMVHWYATWAIPALVALHVLTHAKFGGLAHTMPVYAALTLVMVLSSVGLPGLNGFLGEFTVLLGSMHHVPMLVEAQDPLTFAAYLNMQHNTWLVAGLASTGVIFGAVYLLILYQKTFFGKAAGAAHDDHGHGHDDHHAHGGSYPDLSIREWGQLAVLGIAALVIGLYPKPVWKAIAPATRDSLRPVAATLNKRIADIPASDKLASLMDENRLASRQ
ncbi:MAG TPA: proton-conducting transporter membrane subunit, partial [Candidatus Sumerlaeota bacterium]|nr:proton-conducting transporter membrane subunit [Candidatus Sumerlaeota bacterium]